MVMIFKANFQIDWTIRQGKNTVRGTRCPWVNSKVSGRSPPLCCTLVLEGSNNIQSITMASNNTKIGAAET